MKKLILPLLFISSNLFAEPIFDSHAKEHHVTVIDYLLCEECKESSLKVRIEHHLLTDCEISGDENACKLLNSLIELEQVESKMRSEGLSHDVGPKLLECLRSHASNKKSCKEAKLALRRNKLYKDYEFAKEVQLKKDRRFAN